MLSGPERTRRTEPCWGKASVYSRATRLPAGRRREKRAPSGRTLLPNSAPRGRGDDAEFMPQPCGLTAYCFGPFRAESTADALPAPLRFVPCALVQEGNAHSVLYASGTPRTEPMLTWLP